MKHFLIINYSLKWRRWIILYNFFLLNFHVTLCTFYHRDKYNNILKLSKIQVFKCHRWNEMLQIKELAKKNKRQTLNIFSLVKSWITFMIICMIWDIIFMEIPKKWLSEWKTICCNLWFIKSKSLNNKNVVHIRFFNGLWVLPHP